MNLKSIFLFLFFTLSALSCADEEERELPTVKVLSLDKQEDLFVRAYEEVGPAKIHPTQTHIPGLKPMIEMHYSFVRGLVQDSPAHLELLKGFWQKTSKILETDPLTIGRMKSIAMQLGILLADQQNSLYSLKIQVPAYRWPKLYTTEAWKDIGSYDPHELFDYSDLRADREDEVRRVFGFDCEAILCSKQGGFSYERFVKNYLDRPFVLHLAALCNIREGGPHGGIFANPAFFLKHDFSHERDFISNLFWKEESFKTHYPSQEKGYWDTFKDFLSRIHKSPSFKEHNEIGIFLLCHQLEQDSYFGREVPSSSALYKEVCDPLSERGQFLSLISTITDIWEKKIKRGSVGVDFLFGSLEIDPSFIKGPTAPIGFKSYKELTATESRFKFSIKDKEEDYGQEGSAQEIGSFSATVSYEPGQKKKLSDLSEITWTSEDMKTSQKEEGLDKVRNWIAGMNAQMETRWSADKDYGNVYKDEEYVLRTIYDVEWLPEDARENPSLLRLVEAVHRGMTRFWTEFYHNNKELFSAEPL